MRKQLVSSFLSLIFLGTACVFAQDTIEMARNEKYFYPQHAHVCLCSDYSYRDLSNTTFDEYLTYLTSPIQFDEQQMMPFVNHYNFDCNDTFKYVTYWWRSGAPDTIYGLAILLDSVVNYSAIDSITVDLFFADENDTAKVDTTGHIVWNSRTVCRRRWLKVIKPKEASHWSQDTTFYKQVTEIYYDTPLHVVPWNTGWVGQSLPNINMKRICYKSTVHNNSGRTTFYFGNYDRLPMSTLTNKILYDSLGNELATIAAYNCGKNLVVLPIKEPFDKFDTLNPPDEKWDTLDTHIPPAPEPEIPDNPEELGLREATSLPICICHLYPNPADKLLRIRTEQTIEKVEFIAADGRTLLECGTIEVQNPIDIRHLPKGVYTVKCVFRTAIATKKLIVY